VTTKGVAAVASLQRADWHPRWESVRLPADVGGSVLAVVLDGHRHPIAMPIFASDAVIVPRTR